MWSLCLSERGGEEGGRERGRGWMQVFPWVVGTMMSLLESNNGDTVSCEGGVGVYIEFGAGSLRMT